MVLGYRLYSPRIIIIKEGINERREVDFTAETVFDRNIREVELLKYPAGSEKTDIQEGLVESIDFDDNRIVIQGELIAVRVLMEEEEGILYNVEAQVLNERGREALALSGRIFPVQVRGGGLFTLCCFETFETGNFYVSVTINDELVAEIPFTVERSASVEIE